MFIGEFSFLIMFAEHRAKIHKLLFFAFTRFTYLALRVIQQQVEEKTKKMEEEEEEEKTKEHAEDQDDAFNQDGATVHRRPSRAIPRIDEKPNRSSSTISMVAELNKPKAAQVGRFEN